MSEENGKVCCNCRHNIRTGEVVGIQCHCDIDEYWLSYMTVMTYWCRHWSRDKEQKDIILDYIFLILLSNFHHEAGKAYYITVT